MSNVTPIGSGPVGPARNPGFVEAGGRLGAAIRAIRRGINIAPISPDLAQEAWQHLHNIEPLFAPSTRALMMPWLGKLGAGVTNPPANPNEMISRVEAIWDVCGELPGAVWCDETRRSWFRSERGTFWPAAGELFAHLSAFAAAMSADRAGCSAILAAAQVEPEQRVEPTPVEKEAVVTMLRAWRGEQADRHRAEEAAARPDKPIVPTLHLSPEHLLAQYEQGEREGHAASRYRAEILRQQLAASRGNPPPHPGEMTEGGEHATP